MNSDATDPKPDRTKRTWPLLLGVLAVVIGIVVVLSLVFADSAEDKAITACQDAVLLQLKAPASASFTSTGASEVSEGSFNVSGYVDSQNTFGANVRSNFVCRDIRSPFVTANDVTVDG